MEEEGFPCSGSFSMSWQEVPAGGNGITGGRVTRAAHLGRSEGTEVRQGSGQIEHSRLNSW